MGVMRRKMFGILAVGLLLALGVSAASAQQNSAPADATQALLGAFGNYSIVAVDDAMIIQQAADFYTSLVTNPMFAANVGNVVIDFGNSADQSVVDNYLAGQGSDSDLAQIWVGAAGFGGFAGRGAGGANGGNTSGGAAATPQIASVPQSYTSFLSAIRTANQTLPTKIKVWLGGQAPQRGGNGGGANGAAATQPAPSGGNGGGNGAGRGGFGGGNGSGQFLANLIETQILSQNKKALVIASIAQFNPNGIAFGGFGGRGGFGRGNGGNNGGNGGAASTQQAPQGNGGSGNGGNFTPPQDVRQILEKDYPGKTIVAVVHRGMQEADCNTNLESIMTSWKPPVVASIKGTTLQTALTAQNCHEIGSFGTSINEGWADGYLYLGPIASLTISPAAGQQAQPYVAYMQQLEQQAQQFLQQRQAQSTPPPASA